MELSCRRERAHVCERVCASLCFCLCVSGCWCGCIFSRRTVVSYFCPNVCHANWCSNSHDIFLGVAQHFSRWDVFLNCVCWILVFGFSSSAPFHRSSWALHESTTLSLHRSHFGSRYQLGRCALRSPFIEPRSFNPSSCCFSSNNDFQQWFSSFGEIWG